MDRGVGSPSPRSSSPTAYQGDAGWCADAVIGLFYVASTACHVSAACWAGSSVARTECRRPASPGQRTTAGGPAGVAESRLQHPGMFLVAAASTRAGAGGRSAGKSSRRRHRPVEVGAEVKRNPAAPSVDDRARPAPATAGAFIRRSSRRRAVRRHRRREVVRQGGCRADHRHGRPSWFFTTAARGECRPAGSAMAHRPTSIWPVTSPAQGCWVVDSEALSPRSGDLNAVTSAGTSRSTTAVIP